MRRAAPVVFVLMLALTSCGHTQRPEGIVERWLQSLDQGQAGTPEKYAPDEVSEQVLPGFRDLDPGQFDVTEVGRAVAPSLGPGDPGVSDLEVPFRVVDQDGNEFRGNAEFLEVTQHVVAVVRANDPSARLPSEGGPPIATMPSSSWLGGVVAGTGFVLLAVAAMTLVRRSAKADTEQR